jgi:hypothetical protein
MRRASGLAAAVFAACGLALLSSPVSASAGSTLVLTEFGVPVAKGTPADMGLEFENLCVDFFGGMVASNGEPKDELTFNSVASSQCEAGYSISGRASKSQLSTAGAMASKAKLSLGVPGPCVYAITSLKGHVTIPGAVVGEGVATGKLNKKASNISCPKTRVVEFLFDWTNEVAGEAYEAELHG